MNEERTRLWLRQTEHYHGHFSHWYSVTVISSLTMKTFTDRPISLADFLLLYTCHWQKYIWNTDHLALYKYHYFSREIRGCGGLAEWLIVAKHSEQRMTRVGKLVKLLLAYELRLATTKCFVLYQRPLLTSYCSLWAAPNRLDTTFCEKSLSVTCSRSVVFS